jgi:glyceraldehyde 3-phosphate dehydrogenase
MRIVIGINGFGRIGKGFFLQALEEENIEIKAINAVNLPINEVEDYLFYDSCHKYDTSKYKIEIISKNQFKIKNQIIYLFSERDPEKINWGCDYLIEATGSFLTTEKCEKHNVKKVIISAPPKDNTPTFIYGANHLEYKNQKVISASSCTTNCLAPFIKLVKDNYKIKTCCFTTIHAATSSQYTVDVFKKSARIKRSVFNNIIPHTTGASDSIIKLFPDLKWKITGNSVRVPVSNCSLLDVTLQIEEDNITLENIEQLFSYSEFYGKVFSVNKKELVSSDFMTTTTPCILDLKASLSLGNGIFKLMFWYDNEWSYCSQILRLLDHISDENE